MRAARFVYGACVILAFLLTLIALFTPGWRSYWGTGAPDQGIVTYTCGSGNRQVSSWDCWRWATSKMAFEKVTLAFVIVSLLLQLIAVGMFFGMFSQKLRLNIPATLLVFFAFIFLLAAIIIYGSGLRSKTAYMYSVTFELLADVYLGYSYWIAVVATVLLFIATLSAFGLFGDDPAPR